MESIHGHTLEIWSCWPGARALKDEPFACQSTDLKVSSVHLVSIVGSCFLESLMMVSWRVVAVAAVVTWRSCFFVTRSTLVEKACIEVRHPLWEMAYFIVRMLVHQVTYLVGIVICNGFICEIFWGCVIILVAFDPLDVGLMGAWAIS